MSSRPKRKVSIVNANPIDTSSITTQPSTEETTQEPMENIKENTKEIQRNESESTIIEEGTIISSQQKQSILQKYQELQEKDLKMLKKLMEREHYPDGIFQDLLKYFSIRLQGIEIIPSPLVKKAWELFLLLPKLYHETIDLDYNPFERFTTFDLEKSMKMWKEIFNVIPMIWKSDENWITMEITGTLQTYVLKASLLDTIDSIRTKISEKYPNLINLWYVKDETLMKLYRWKDGRFTNLDWFRLSIDVKCSLIGKIWVEIEDDSLGFIVNVQGRLGQGSLHLRQGLLGIQIKQMLNGVDNLFPYNMILVFNGREIGDEDSVKECGIKSGDKIIILPRVPF